MSANKDNERSDLLPISFESLDWSDAEKANSLNKIFNQAIAHANKVIDWYLLSKSSKKYWARNLRLATILLTTLFALIPVVAELCECFSAAWATVVLGLAAMCVAIDRFFGFSSAWMRYMATEHTVRKQLHSFEIDREILKVNWESGSPNQHQVLEGLNATKEFILAVDEAVRKETEQWRTEFQSIIKEIDKAANNNKS